MPSVGLLADAYARFGIRPARYANRPASTASFIAVAIATGSCASAMAVFISTPSAPSSIAMVASDAVPTPASTMTGTRACSRMMRDVVRVLDAQAGSDRRSERHHRGRARLLEFPADHRIVVRVGQDDEAFADQDAVASSRATLSGKSVRSSPITSSFTQFESPTSRPSLRSTDRLRRPYSIPPCSAAGRCAIRRCSREAIPSIDRDRFTRRTATVTISVPLARCASAITACEGYLPVPTMSRDRNVFPAMTSGSATMANILFAVRGSLAFARST